MIKVAGGSFIDGVFLMSKHWIVAGRPGELKVRRYRGSWLSHFFLLNHLKGLWMLLETPEAEKGKPFKMSKEEIVRAIWINLVLPTLLLGRLFEAMVHTPGWAHLLVLVGFFIVNTVVARLTMDPRMFRYHGAEHKVGWAIEKGVPLTLEEVRKMPIIHPRCGTAYITRSLVAIVLLDLVGIVLHLGSWWAIAIVPLSFLLTRLPVFDGLGLIGERLTLLEPGDEELLATIEVGKKIVELEGGLAESDIV